MKSKFILPVFLLICSALPTQQSCTSSTAETTTNDKVSFYDVPLVCGAYKEIGCGSRAKPALLDLEQHQAVEEAWLNRQGTIIAIVWKDNNQAGTIAKQVFENHQIDFEELENKDRRKAFQSFENKEFWYRGADVDKLSIEEAEHIAKKYTDYSLSKGLITQEEVNGIKPEIESYFETELVKTRTRDQLSTDLMDKFKTDVIGIFSSHIGQVRTDKLIEVFAEFEEKQRLIEDEENARSACD